MSQVIVDFLGVLEEGCRSKSLIVNPGSIIGLWEYVCFGNMCLLRSVVIEPYRLQKVNRHQPRLPLTPLTVTCPEDCPFFRKVEEWDIVGHRRMIEVIEMTTKECQDVEIHHFDSPATRRTTSNDSASFE